MQAQSHLNSSAPGEGRCEESLQILVLQRGRVFCSFPFAHRFYPACLFTEAKASDLVSQKGPRFASLFCRGLRCPQITVNPSHTDFLKFLLDPRQYGFLLCVQPPLSCWFTVLLIFSWPLGISYTSSSVTSAMQLKVHSLEFIQLFFFFYSNGNFGLRFL